MIDPAKHGATDTAERGTPCATTRRQVLAGGLGALAAAMVVGCDDSERRSVPVPPVRAVKVLAVRASWTR
ncbi:hypothetical protein [Streptomyces sp. NPDC059786]|uniref:hypothetical protein n=1 Tax=Streptomyces sp. NPDC059786 TaxID=3346946 RepID=UPI00365FBFFB